MDSSVRPEFVDSSGGAQLRCWRSGQGSAAIVVLPGLVQAASVVAARLAEEDAGQAFVVFELPGIGGSADVAAASLEQAAAALRSAIGAAGLAGAAVLAFDLAAPLAALIDAPRVFLNLDLARGWARRSLAPPDLTPRPDGTHLNALFAHLRDAQLLDATSGRRAARAGDPLPSPQALDAMCVTAGLRPQSYAGLWLRCSEGMAALAAQDAGSLAEALAQLRALSAGAAPAGETPPEMAAGTTAATAAAPAAETTTEAPAQHAANALARPAFAIRRSYVSTPRGRVHLRSAGPQRAPLIALHSAPGSAAPLKPLLEGLGASRRVIAPDFIGNGDSDKPDLPVDIATLAQDALAVADALGLARFDLWGTHTGALIALEAAIAAPERVGRLILEAPPLLAPSFSADLLANYFPPLVPDGWGLHLQQAWNMRRDMFLFWPWYRAERGAVRPLDLPDAGFLHDWTLGLLTSGATYHRSYRSAFEYDTQARLPLLRRPALVCAGPADMLADGLKLARALLGPDCEVTPLPATVWYPNQDREAVARTIAAYERFLEGMAIG